MQNKRVVRLNLEEGVRSTNEIRVVQRPNAKVKLGRGMLVQFEPKARHPTPAVRVQSHVLTRELCVAMNALGAKDMVQHPCDRAHKKGLLTREGNHRCQRYWRTCG